jgi:hypothetical protein
VGQLVDQGKLALDAPIGRYLPGLRADVAQVTVDQLLHHQSGVASLTTFHPQSGDQASATNANRELAAQAAAQPLAVDLVGLERGDVIALELDAALRRVESRAHQVEERRLPRAVRSDDGVPLTRPHFEVDSPEDRRPPEALRDSRQPQRRRALHSNSPCWRGSR